MNCSAILKTCIVGTGILACLAMATLAEDVGVSPPKIDRDLQTIENEYRNGCDMKQVERRCLELIKAYPAKEDQGKIYAKIPWLYNIVFAGFDQAKRDTLSRETVISYCMLALDCKPDPVTTAQTYVFWGSVSNVTDAKIGTEEYSKFRSDAAAIYLKGLRYLLDLGVPEEVPAMSKTALHVDASSTISWEQRAVANKQTTHLVMLRMQLACALTSLYSAPPFKADELSKLASDIVKDKDVVGKIVAKVEASNERSKR